MSDVLDSAQTDIRPDLEELIKRTCQRLRSQGKVPLSPGLSSNGEILLCGAAALVTEAVAMTNSREAAGIFSLEAVQRDSEFIVRTGENVGLQSGMVRGVLVSNDKLGAAERLAGVLTHLDGLAREQGQAGAASVTR